MGPEGEVALVRPAWILWLRDEYGIFEKVSYGGCVLKNASAMIAEREALRKGIEHLTVLFPTEVSSFDFQVENSGRTVQYKLNAQSLRLFGFHSDVNDAHRAGANRLKTNKNKPVEPTVNVMKADSHLQIDPSTVCIIDAKSAFDHLVRESTGGHCRRTAQELCVIRKSMQTLRARCRWVPHERMVVDALTKRHGNSVTMLRLFARWSPVNRG